jgi:hypothetical protein
VSEHLESESTHAGPERVQWERVCRGCGATFQTSNLNQRRCRSDCDGRGRSRRVRHGGERLVTSGVQRPSPGAGGVAASMGPEVGLQQDRVPDAALTSESLAAALRSGRATPEAALRAMAQAHPVDVGPRSGPTDSVTPLYASWDDWLQRGTAAEIRRWFQQMAHTANRPRLLSGVPMVRVSPGVVWRVLAAAEGRCAYCGSLAVERRPSGPHGEPIAWAAVGRRIGSLGHRTARFHGGGNEAENLAWSCLWCNTWLSERSPGAADHGGFYPQATLSGTPISDPWGPSEGDG